MTMSRKVRMLVDLPDGDTFVEHGARYARQVLAQCGGNKRAACWVLDISYHTLNRYVAMPLRDRGRFGEGGVAR